MTEIIYKQECYRLLGCCFEFFNILGPGLREKNYQKALEAILDREEIHYESQLYVPIKVDGKTIGRYFLDLLVDQKIAIELKVGDHFHKRDIAQLLSYLKSKQLLLGLLINFSSSGVISKRIVNLR